jgi:hypothetical protein
MNSASKWLLEPLSRPSEAHAGDAVEIVAGEVVRRVTLPMLDFDVLHARNDWLEKNDKEPGSDELAAVMELDIMVVQAALRRLAVAGIVPRPEEHSLQ